MRIAPSGFIRTSTALVAALLLILALGPSVSKPKAANVEGAPRIAPRTSVRIGVLGLFHPTEFKVSATTEQALAVQVGDQRIILEESSGSNPASINFSGADTRVAIGKRVFHATVVTVTGRGGGPADFILTISGKITRSYYGTLEIRPSAGNLTAIVTMDLEEAVASVVAAENAPGTPVEAMKAQAIASRSYLVSGRGRHRDFDFCDTTHCQFLRGSPASGSTVHTAVTATRGLVLSYNSAPFAAMYTRSCSGRTRTPSELGLPPAAYPYYSAECAYCRKHPQRWTTRLPLSDVSTLRPSNESDRLNVGRRLGWSAVPSNNFVETGYGDEVVLVGTGYGHGMGLCQSGARAMAREGSTFRDILLHYYPNTAIISLPDGRPPIVAEHAANRN